jgi:hypothetical protein
VKAGALCLTADDRVGYVVAIAGDTAEDGRCGSLVKRLAVG